NEGEFARLKYLLIHECELEIWESDNTHFPCLEQIHLGIVRLNEFPSDFAEILPLQVIDLHRCENSLLTSAKEVSKQRENLGYDALQIRALMPGLLRISVQRGINLAARNHPKRSPYAAVRISKQVLKTRVVRKTVNPEWRDDLTVAVLDPRQPISVTVYDRNMFSVDEKMGDAEFDVRPNALPNGTISTRISPSSSNCLSEEMTI
ncbi:PREDICTED: ADP-ribosylation factor GTPase-activating protein AGD12-like, partial [Erythranthe guttata]|uniref:ADP-ribosylation factor GTPase-activating protein AGD12-like n=1 Tax=Erythranthe guttata TaxID=4155 RepID=UPI00064DC84D